MRSLRSLALPFALLTALLAANFYSSRALIERSYRSIPFEQRDSYRHPPEGIYRALFLNYETFASSVAWISGLLYFGEWRISKPTQPPEHLERFALLARDLDEDFTGIYTWFNATHVGSHHLPDRPMTFEELETLRRFNAVGLERHPDDWELFYTTGMNYIGYSYEREPEERLTEIDHAIGYLKRCAFFHACPETVPFTIAYLYSLRAELKGDKEGANDLDQRISFYKSLYAASGDASQRAKLALTLGDLGVPREELEALEQFDAERLEAKRHASTHAYLPLDLWTQIVYPTPGALDLLSASPHVTD